MMKLKVRKLVFGAFICAAVAGGAFADLPRRIDTIVNRQQLKKVQFGVQIVALRTPQVVVYSRNADVPMTPASNMKIITTAAAIKYLGPDFEYQTRVGLIGDTLVIIGGGDPLSGDKATDEKKGRQPGWLPADIVQALKDNNVPAIKDIIIDSSVFDDQRTHPSWPAAELNKWYACEVAGLNYNGNCVSITAETVAGQVQLAVEPATKYVEIVNQCRPASSGPDTVWGSRPSGSNTITVLGKCHKQCEPVRVAIERPPAFFGFLLAEELSRGGITVQGRFVEKSLDTLDQFKELKSYRTGLWDVLERCNKDSFGLAAEALVKTIAAHPELGGKNGSWAAGREVIVQYLQQLGIPAEQFRIDDGSGLSKENKLSANAITRVLLDVFSGPQTARYKATLAVGGIDGTAGRYFKDSKYKGRVFGKTGYIDGVKSFSGICCAPDGDYIFSILTNNANGNTRDAINEIVTAIIDEGTPASRH